MTQLSEKKKPPQSSGTIPKSTAYDTAPPKALLDFMMKDWKAPAGGMPKPIENAEAFGARRRALSALYPGELLVIPTGHEKVRANDTLYRFRPSSDFFYLTGNLEPDCVLVMVLSPRGRLRI